MNSLNTASPQSYSRAGQEWSNPTRQQCSYSNPTYDHNQKVVQSLVGDSEDQDTLSTSCKNCVIDNAVNFTTFVKGLSSVQPLFATVEESRSEVLSSYERARTKSLRIGSRMPLALSMFLDDPHEDD